VKHYRIEYFQDHPRLQRWATFGIFTAMPKSFAEGAFAMLKSLNGGNKWYRLLDNEHKIVDEHRTGIIVVN
jgi:hypothetical protein